MPLVAQKFGRAIVYLLFQGLLCLGVLAAVRGKISVKNLSVHLALALRGFKELLQLELLASLDVLLEAGVDATSFTGPFEGVP